MDLFAEGQSSEIGVLKRNILDHTCHHIYRIGIVEINDAGPPENSHGLIKRPYCETLERKVSEVQETIHRFNNERNKNTSNLILKRQKAMNDDGNSKGITKK